MWLDDAVDSFEIEETGENFVVYLVTTRGRKFLGGKEFIFPKQNLTAEIVLSEIIKQFYKFHAPKEIRLSRDFPARKSLQDFLSEKFARPVKISIVKDGLNITTKRKIKQTKFESEFEKIGESKSADEIKTELQKIFNLKKKPAKIEVFDVAHISGQDFVAASVAWKNGTIAPEDFRVYISDGQNELDTMANSVAERLANKTFPDLLLIDGGISQLRAVKEVTENLNQKRRRHFRRQTAGQTRRNFAFSNVGRAKNRIYSRRSNSRTSARLARRSAQRRQLSASAAARQQTFV